MAIKGTRAKSPGGRRREVKGRAVPRPGEPAVFIPRKEGKIKRSDIRRAVLIVRDRRALAARVSKES